MTPTRKQPSNIALDVLTNVYQNTTLQTGAPQPFYILHRDTIRNFLHEKMGVFGLQARALGLLGIEASLIVALATATFHDLWFLKGDVIGAAFVIAAIIIAILLLTDMVALWRTRKERSVDVLTDQLGKQGTSIAPTPLSGLDIKEL